ncbi:hypothetical protein [Natrialba aegyptia]|uniref:Right handed beta helix domain-containing protein n=1 Tax=Natrialba aegyptia DSM 13077 TaxID=1227491 RepID=M0AGG3_9EURY|nr:hypothetical protein [Natrialba aegyptia]ELY97634.1 hypothetical protein C480_21844 [Natrialba aegyptia DSM 13077]
MASKDRHPEKSTRSTVSRRGYLRLGAVATVGVGTLAAVDEYTDTGSAGAVSTADPSPADSEIGGGAAYSNDVTESDATTTVSTGSGLKTALQNAGAGDVVWVDSGATIDMTGESNIEIPSGVTLASGRGIDGSQGALLHVDSGMNGESLFRSSYETGVRVTGIQLRGPFPGGYFDPPEDPDEPGYTEKESAGIFVYNTESSRTVEIDNCHLWGWTSGAVRLGANANGGTSCPTGTHVHHCSIHTNAMEHLGYGVDLLNGDQHLIEYCYFDLNRHCIDGFGNPENGYEARYNIVDDRTVSHAFDMHNWATNHGDRDVAGSTISIHHNTFRYTNEVEGEPDEYRDGGPQEYIKIREAPDDRCDIDNNWFQYKEKPPAGTTGGDQYAYTQTGVSSWTNMYESNNAFGPEEPAADIGAPRTGNGGGGGGTPDFEYNDDVTAVDASVDSHDKRSGLQLSVTNNFDSKLNITDVTIEPANAAIDELSDHSMEEGKWLSELYVDADIQDSAADINNGLSLPGSIDLRNDGHDDSDRRWAVFSPGSTGELYLYQFENDGSAVDMVGETVALTIDYYLDDGNSTTGSKTLSLSP